MSRTGFRVLKYDMGLTWGFDSFRVYTENIGCSNCSSLDEKECKEHKWCARMRQQTRSICIFFLCPKKILQKTMGGAFSRINNAV